LAEKGGWGTKVLSIGKGKIHSKAPEVFLWGIRRGKEERSISGWQHFREGRER